MRQIGGDVRDEKRTVHVQVQGLEDNRETTSDFPRAKVRFVLLSDQR